MEDASREGWYTPLLYGCRILLNLMLKHFTLVAVSFFGTAATSAATLPEYKMQDLPPLPYSIIQEEPTAKTQTATKEVAPETIKEKRLICKGCNGNENLALKYLQDRGITDKYALATIMGNIKQESQFVPNICEGGSRTSYRNCYGGYGLIQWTSSSRYYGLGNHSRKIGLNPSTIEAQLDYMLDEPQWKEIERKMKTPGKSLYHYMNQAYSWIGWGIHGSRTSYARDYVKRMISEV